ncbi:hypothetical protein HZH66_013203 [Vespula vulgaris]|uniref:Chitin-binding type-2 domain-containing protein n=1 Tax=Vespula vulgaris TaxID=7454 RepID=A0A834JC39_VESVU|nr:hypothetical protein HZH66_013203 [Vespula vulgaris]
MSQRKLGRPEARLVSLEIVGTISLNFIERYNDKLKNETSTCPSMHLLIRLNRNSETVNLPYPLDCFLYISCGETETIETCPDNLVFNKKTGLCDTPANAQCVPCWQQPSPY